MKFIPLTVILFLLLGISAVKEDLPPTAAAVYSNARFEYCFTYDANVFNKVPPDTYANGITIADSTGTLFLECYASSNPYQLTVADVLEENLQYLMRNEPSGPKTIKEFKDETSYHISFETEETFFSQEMILEKFYYKVLTIRLPLRKRALFRQITASSHFVERETIVSR